MRYIVEVAHARGRIQAKVAVRLVLLQEAGCHLMHRTEHVAHIVKQHRAQVVADKWKRKRRAAQLRVVQEQRFTAHGESAGQASRTGLVDAEAAVRSRTAGEKEFRQRNKYGIGVRLLHADARRASEHPAALVKLIVTGILHYQPGEVRL